MKLDWVRMNFLRFCDLLIMSVDCLRQPSKFLTALEPVTKFEEFDSNRVVDHESPSVMPDGVQNYFANVGVEGEGWEDFVFFVDEVHLAVS